MIVMLVISLIETTVYMSFKNEYWLIVVFIAWMLGAYLSMFVEMIGFIIIRKNKNTNAILMRKLMLYFAIKAISLMPIFVTAAIISLLRNDVTFVFLFFLVPFFSAFCILRRHNIKHHTNT